MPEYVPTNEDQQQDLQPNPNQHPRQPLEIQPDGTWILGRGADRWIPSENQMGDMRWLVERDLRKELGVPPQWAEDAEKIEFHKRQLALLDLAKQAPRCEHVFTDGRCCKAPRVKKGKLCYAHTLMEEKRPLELNLPPLEDANAVMLWLMDVLRGLAEGRISEKTAGLMFYGLQLAMVNARFTTFSETNHAEMVRKAPRDRRNRRNRASSPKSEERALPQRTTGHITAEGAEAAEDRRNRTESPTSEPKSLPQSAQRNRQDRASSPTSHPKKPKPGFLGAPESPSSPSSPSSEAKGLPQRTQRSIEEEEPSERVTAENAEVAEIGKGEKPEEGTALRVEDGLESQNAEGIPGVESAKSIFFGVEPGEGVADNRPVSPPPEPPRKSSQSEILVIPKDVEHHLRG
jgi:hypothetical protein